MSEEPEQTNPDQQGRDATDEEPVVAGRESANEVAEELKEQEELIEEGGETSSG